MTPEKMRFPFDQLVLSAKAAKPKKLDSVAFNAGIRVAIKYMSQAVHDSLIEFMSPASTTRQLQLLQASVTRNEDSSEPHKPSGYTAQVSCQVGDGLPVTVHVYYDPPVAARITGPIELQHPAEGGDHELHDVTAFGHSILEALEETYANTLLEEAILKIEEDQREHR